MEYCAISINMPQGIGYTDPAYKKSNDKSQIENKLYLRFEVFWFVFAILE